MAWFEQGFSSLKGQLSNLAKNVLVDEDDFSTSNEAPKPASSSTTAETEQVDSGWSEAEQGVFVGQDEGGKEARPVAAAYRSAADSSQLSDHVGSEDGGSGFPMGLSNPFQLFKSIRDQTGPTLRGEARDAEVQVGPELLLAGQSPLQSPELSSEVESLRRIVRELESQITSSQNENTNLTRELVKLDTQHEEAIKQILTVKDEAVKELDLLREQMAQKEAESAFQAEKYNQAELLSEVESLRRVVRELESQIASSQDENANLSTGLEELDIQHQEAIQRILTVKDETVKELDQLREQMAQKEAECSRLADKNKSLIKQVEMLNLDIQGNETLSQENAELREKLSELMKAELPSIPEQSAAEEHVRSLEAEAAALRESRDNLERETASLLNQLRQRDATLREVDAKLEDITKEKEIKEREMTQIVFECNSLREELNASAEKIAILEKEGVEARNELSSLRSKLDEALEGNERFKTGLENAKREVSLAKDESATLKSELESLREDLGGGEAKSLLDLKQLEQAKQGQKEALDRVEALKQQVLSLERALESSSAEVESGRVLMEVELSTAQRELDSLRDLAREYGIQKDVFREKEAELKRQLTEASLQLSTANTQMAEAKQEAERLKSLNSRLEGENAASLSTKAGQSEEIDRYKHIIHDTNLEKEKLINDVTNLKKKLESASDKEKELVHVQSDLESLQSEVNSYQNRIKFMEEKMAAQEKELNQNESNKIASEKLSTLLVEKENQVSQIIELSNKIEELKIEASTVLSREEALAAEKAKLEDVVKQLRDEKAIALDDKSKLEKANDMLLSELGGATRKAELVEKELVELREGRSKATGEEVEQLKHQVDHLKDELREAYEERGQLVSQTAEISADREKLLQQVQALRGELDTIPELKQQLYQAKSHIEERNAETGVIQNELKRLNSALSVQLSNNENLYKEKSELIQKNEQLQVQIQRIMARLEEVEGSKTKEVESLKQEIDNLKTQLEYASQLLRDVERQEGEGQTSGEQSSQKLSAESHEELSRLSAALLKEQTDKKILQNQLTDKEERLDKAETQLNRLKNHLVEVQDSYSLELSTTEEKLREMQAQLIAAEDRARTSTTAYTSASIRSNQQVESLREQVRLLTEHKERLEQQVSFAEDTAAKQAAAVTRLQAVLHHFQMDKQKDIEFETERIRRDLIASTKKNDGLSTELKSLQEQLEDARRGLAASQRLNEQILRQSETITQLKNEIFELNEKLRTKEEKVNDLSSENKVDRQLVTNLLLGYVTSPVESKSKVLGVLSQVLSFSKEERQKVGLEPGGRQQTLSEAFIKFLQTESQPRSEVILPLATTTSLPPSRKSSLLTPDVPNLPHFPVGRNPGSILKDVLQDRRPE